MTKIHSRVLSRKKKYRTNQAQRKSWECKKKTNTTETPGALRPASHPAKVDKGKKKPKKQYGGTKGEKNKKIEGWPARRIKLRVLTVAKK